MRIFVHCIESRTESRLLLYMVYGYTVRLITKFTSTSIQVYTTCEYNKRKQHRLTPSPSNKTMSMICRGSVGTEGLTFAALWWGNHGTTITRGRICARKLFKYLPKFTAATRDISRLEGNTRTSSLAMHSRWHSVTYVVFSPNSPRSTLLYLPSLVSRFPTIFPSNSFTKYSKKSNLSNQNKSQISIFDKSTMFYHDALLKESRERFYASLSRLPWKIDDA